MNKSVFVTGATNGTGFAIAERFAREGYDVFVGSREEERANEAASAIAEKHGVKAYGYGMKVFDEADVRRIFADIRSKGYLLDTIVLNAANLGIGQDTLTVPIEEFMNVINTNMGWNFMLAREAALQMKEKGGGSIALVYWYPDDIMTHDFEGAVTLEIAAPREYSRITLVDPMDGKIYEIPESIMKPDGYGGYVFEHLVIRDYPLFLILSK